MWLSRPLAVILSVKDDIPVTPKVPPTVALVPMVALPVKFAFTDVTVLLEMVVLVASPIPIVKSPVFENEYLSDINEPSPDMVVIPLVSIVFAWNAKPVPPAHIP